MTELSQELVRDKVAGALLGTAVADAIGLPREGLSRRRAGRIFFGKPLGHRFILGRGMVSDDTEHACMVAQALLKSGGDPDTFARSLAWKLRLWLLGVPAGIGLATLKGILRLWMGFSPANSGVVSAGNGPAMRAPLLGIVAGGDIDQLRNLVDAGTRLTHIDPRAQQGALIVAMACHYGFQRRADQIDHDEFLELAQEHVSNDELRTALSKVRVGLCEGITADQMADRLGLSKGITGYVVHTVPMAIFCWLRHPSDFREAVEEVILCGGDTDTTAAITGALAGATLGESAICPQWIDGLLEWPRSVTWMRKLAGRLAMCISDPNTENRQCLPLFWPGIIVRNLFFTVVVLLHALRRLLPPY